MNEQKISVRDAHIEMNLKCKTLEMENSEVTLSDYLYCFMFVFSSQQYKFALHVEVCIDAFIY